MSGSGGLPSRPPAAKVGGQRRRSARPPPRPPLGVPRSSTLPVLPVESASSSSAAGGAVDDPSAEKEGSFCSSTYQEVVASLVPSQGMLHFPPPAGVPAQSRGKGRDETEPTTATGSVAEGKKKHAGLTLSNPFRSSSRQNLEQTPLPPATPTKAAKLLGVETNIGSGTAHGDGSAFERPRTAKNDSSTLDGVDEQDHRARRELPQQQSMPYLGPTSTTPGTDPFDDLIVESDDDDDHKEPKSKGIFGRGKNIAKKMYAHVSTEQKSPERSQPREAPRVPVSHSEHASRKNRRGRRNRKQRTQVDRMTPLTEASNDHMHSAYLDGEEDTDPNAIPEYPHSRTSGGGPVRPPRYESLMPPSAGRFRLSTDELSDNDDETDDYEDEDETPLLPKYTGRSTKSNEQQTLQPPAFNLRSPLQNVEDHLLDVAEKQLEATKISSLGEEQSSKEGSAPHEAATTSTSSSAYRHGPAQTSETPFMVPQAVVVDVLENRRKNLEAQKMLLDFEVAKLKASHEQMKADFAPYAAGAAAASENDDDDKSPSIRGSIDLDEEPSVHVATAMPMMRITPGMVRVVDIPARKKKST